MGDLLLVEELVNTRSLEFGTDDIATPEALAAWLEERGLLPAGVAVDDAGLDRARVAREGLRALIARNSPGPDAGARPGPTADLAAIDAADLDALAALAEELPLVVDVRSTPPRLTPRTSHPVDDALARLLAVVAAAVAAGTWDRMKVCRQTGCRWAYYDESRNRSRAWCSMETCGNRAKARSFRKRQH